MRGGRLAPREIYGQDPRNASCTGHFCLSCRDQISLSRSTPHTTSTTSPIRIHQGLLLLELSVVYFALETFSEQPTTSFSKIRDPLRPARLQARHIRRWHLKEAGARVLTISICSTWEREDGKEFLIQSAIASDMN